MSSQERVERRKQLLLMVAMGDENAAQELAEMDEAVDHPPETPERAILIERNLDSMRFLENLTREQLQDARNRLEQCSDAQLMQWNAQNWADAFKRFDANHKTVLEHGQGEPAKKFAGPYDELLAKKHPEWSYHRRLLGHVGRRVEEHESDESEAHRVVQDMLKRQRQRGMPESFAEETVDDESDSSTDMDQMRAAEADYEASQAQGIADLLEDRMMGPYKRARELNEQRQRMLEDDQLRRIRRGG